MLSIVATPIGNLEDITLRAVRTLKEADIIVAEDTRHARILLQRYEIGTRLESFHSHSSDEKLQYIVRLLVEGKNIALITDAGTPGISDPGVMLIKAAIDSGVEVTSIPGPSAVITALTLSGLPIHRFLYLGFLPLKKGRKTMIASLKDVPYTVVLYEAPHRIMKTLSELREALGERQIAVCREMTKMHEEVVRGRLSEVITHFEANKPRGEFTLVIEGN